MPSKYIKSVILSLLLFTNSYVLTGLIYEPVRTQNYFAFDLVYAMQVVGLMLLILYIFSLSVGVWGNWQQYLFVALPPIAGAALFVMQINLFYGTVVSFLLYLLLCVDLSRSDALRKILTKFRPNFILHLSTSGLMFIFSVLGGVMVIISSPNLPQVNVGKAVTSAAEPYLKKMVQSQLESQLQSQSMFLDDASLQEAFQGIPVEDVAQEYTESFDFSNLIETQVNGLIAPYKDLLHPILAVLMFVLFQFYAGVAKFIYAPTVTLLFAIAKKVGFLKVETVKVDREELKF